LGVPLAPARAACAKVSSAPKAAPEFEEKFWMKKRRIPTAINAREMRVRGRLVL
jgi:hypothetical protein